jgi:ABC-type Na+ efflux pump permease subunit
MSRLVVLILVILVIVGGLVFLSTTAEEQPTRTIEVDVPQGGNAS